MNSIANKIDEYLKELYTIPRVHSAAEAIFLSRYPNPQENEENPDGLSPNHWETQPRKENGEWACRNDADESKNESSKSNDFSFDDEYNKNHIIKGEGVGAKKKGVIGAHNRDEFFNMLKNNGFDVTECIIKETQHPTITGISEIEYQLPKKTGDGKIIIPKEFKLIETPKTVYDPKIISNEKIIEWGKEAMRNGIVDGNRVFGINNGLKFVGYLKNNSITEIKNFYPIIK